MSADFLQEQLRRQAEESAAFAALIRGQQEAAASQVAEMRSAIVGRKPADVPVRSPDVQAVIRIMVENPILAPRIRQMAEKLLADAHARIQELVSD